MKKRNQKTLTVISQRVRRLVGLAHSQPPSSRVDWDALPKLLSLRQTAELLDVHPNTLRLWDRQGVLPAVRLGVRRDRRYDRTRIQAEWQSRQLVAPASRPHFRRLVLRFRKPAWSLMVAIGVLGSIAMSGALARADTGVPTSVNYLPAQCAGWTNASAALQIDTAAGASPAVLTDDNSAHTQSSEPAISSQLEDGGIVVGKIGGDSSDLTCQSYQTDGNSPRADFVRAQLQLRLATQTGMNNADLIQIQAQLDDGDWTTLDAWPAAKLPDQPITLALPMITNFDQIGHLHVRVHLDTEYPDPPTQVWVDGSKIVVDEAAPAPVDQKQIRRDQSNLAPLVSFSQTAYQITQHPILTVPKKHARKFLFFTTGYDQWSLKDVVIRDADGTVTDAPYQANDASDGGDLNTNLTVDPAQLHPGKYTVAVTMEKADGSVVTVQDEFLWGVVVMNISRAVPAPGQDQTLTMGILDDQGHTICDADLSLTVTSPKGHTTVFSTDSQDQATTITRSPNCVDKGVSKDPDYVASLPITEAGTYHLHLSAESSAGHRELDDNFVADQSAAFAVERVQYPSRIYPLAQYPVRIAITPKQDYIGTVRERVPIDFQLSEVFPGATVYPDPDDPSTHIIEWIVDWQAGETNFVGYTFDAPDISPAIFPTGPLTIGGSFTEPPKFSENRQWQIASDATTATKYAGTAADGGDGNNCTWATPSNATGNTTGTSTTCSLQKNGEVTNRLILTNFGFSTSDVPSGSTINGVTVQVEWQPGGTDQYDSTVQLTLNGSTGTGTNQAFTLTQSGKAIRSYGGVSDTWSSGVTAADVVSSNFGLVLGYSDNSNGSSANISVYRVNITIDYTAPPSGITISGGCFTDPTEGTACTDDGGDQIKVAINGVPDSGADTTVDGSWSFTTSTAPSSGDILTIYRDGEATESKEATTVVKYDGSGNVDLVKMYESYLVIGTDSGSANSDQTITNADLDPTGNGYDGTDDEDVVYTYASNALSVTGSRSLYVITGDTYQPESSPGNDTISAANITTDTSATITANSNSFTASGSFTNNGTFTAGTSTLTMSGTGTLTTGSSSLNNLTTSGTGTITLANATHTLTGNLTLASGATLTAGTSTIAMTGASKTIDGGGKSVNNLTISAATTVQTNNVTVAGTLTIAASTTLTITSVTLTNSGTSEISWGASSVISGTGTVTFTNTAGGPGTGGTLSTTVRYDASGGNIASTTIDARTYGGALEWYANVAAVRTITLASGTYSVTGNATVITGSSQSSSFTVTGATGNPAVTISGNLAYTKGGSATPAITSGTGTWTVAGNATFTNGTYTATTNNTFTMTGTGGKNLVSSGQTFSNLTIDPSSTGTITLTTSSITVNLTLTVASGDTFAIGSNNVTLARTTSTALSLSGTLSGTGSVTYRTTTAFPTGGTFSANLIMDATSGNLTLSGGRTYGGNVTAYVQVSVTADRSVILGAGTITITGSFTIDDNGDLNSHALTVTGVTNSPTVNISGSVGGTDYGGGQQTVLSMGGGTWTVSGDFNLSAIVTASSTGTLVMNGTSKTLTTNGQSLSNVTLSGTISLASATHTITGALTLSGTVTANSSTILMSGTANLIGGGNTLNNLTINGTNNTVSLITSDLSVSGTLTIGGAADGNNDTLDIGAGRTLTSTSSGTVTLVGSGTDSITGSGTLDIKNGNLGALGTISAPVQYDDAAVTVTARNYGNNLLFKAAGTSRTFTLGSGTFTISGNLNLNASGAGDVAVTGASNNPTVNLTGNLGFVGGGGGAQSITSGSGTWTVGGDIDFTGGVYTASSGNTVTMTGSGKSITSASNALVNFIVSGGTITQVGALAATGTFQLTSSGTFTQAANSDLTLTGDTVQLDSGTTFTKASGTGTLIMDGVSDNQSFTDSTSPQQDLGHVQIGSSPGTTKLKSDMTATDLTIPTADTFETHGWDVFLSDFLDCQGSCILDLTDGPPSQSGDPSVLDVGGDFTMSSSATFTAADGKVFLNSTSGSDTNRTFTTGGKTYYNVETKNAGATNDNVTISGNLVVTGTFTHTDGELVLNSGNPNVNTSGNVSIASGATVTKGTGTWTFDGTTATTYTDSNGTPQNIGVVSINKTDTVAPSTNNKVTLASSMTADTVTIDGTSGSEDTLDLANSGYTLTLANAGATATVLTITGTLTVNSSSTVKFTATNSGGNIDIPTLNYASLSCAPGSAETYDVAGSFSVATALTVDTNCTYTIASSQTTDLTNTSSSPLTLNGTITGTGRLTYHAPSPYNFPTSGTISSILRFDITAGDVYMPQRTYGGNVEEYNGGSGIYSLRVGTAASQTITISGNLTVIADGTANAYFDCLSQNPTINIGGDIDFTGAGAGTEYIRLGSSDWTVSGNVDLTGGSIANNTGNTFIMNGTGGKNLISAGLAFNNVTIDPTTADTIYLATSNTRIDGTLTIADNDTLYINSGVVLVMSSSINANVVMSANSTLTSPNWGGAMYYGGATFPSVGTVSVYYMQFIAYWQDMTIPARTWSNDTTGINFYNSSSSNRTFTFGTGAGQTFSMPGTIYTEVRMYAIGTGTATFDFSTYNPDFDIVNLLNSGGSCSSTCTVNMGSGTFTVGGNVTATAWTVNAGTSLLKMNGTSKSLTSSGNTFANYEVSGGSVTLADATDFSGNVTLSGGTLTGPSAAFTVGGNWSNTGGTYTEGTGTVTLNGTSSVTLDSGCSNTDTCTTQNFYNLVIDKTDASDANDNVTLTNNGIRVTNTLTITDGELVQGAYNVRAEGATTSVSIASAGKWSNISTGDIKIDAGGVANAGVWYLDNQGNGDGCSGGDTDAISLDSTDGATTRALSGAGTFTFYDVTVNHMNATVAITVNGGTDGGTNSGSFTFNNCSAGITVSGTIYQTDETNTYNCSANNLTIDVAIDGTTDTGTDTCTASGGTFSITTSATPAGTGSQVVVFIDSVESVNATTVTLATDGSSNITGLKLYDGRVAVTYETGNSSIANSDLATGDSGDSGIRYSVSAGALTVDSGMELHVLAGKSFIPAGTVTTTSTGTSSGAAGDLHIPSTATLNMGTNALSVGGDFVNDGTLTVSSGQTITLTATGSGFAFDSNGATLYNVDFSGSSGSWSCNDSTTISTTLTVGTNATLDVASSKTLTLARTTSTALSLSGTLSGSGLVIYKTTTAFPTGGTFSADLRMDASSGNQNMGARTYGGNVEIYNLNGSSARTVTLGTAGSQTITISGSLTLNDNADIFGLPVTLAGNTYNPTVNVTGNVGGTDYSGSEATVLSMGSGTWNVGGSFNLTYIPTFNHNSGTLVMNGSGTLTSNGETLYNLTLNSSSAITLAAATHTVAGNLVLTGTGSHIFTGSTILMNGTGGKTIDGGGKAVNNLTIDPTSAATIALTNTNIQVNGTLTVATGDTLSIPSGRIVSTGSSGTVTINGTGTISGDGTLRMYSSNLGTGGTLNTNVTYESLYGNLTLVARTYSGATHTVQLSNQTGSVRTITAGSGTFTIEGALYLLTLSANLEVDFNTNSPTISVNGSVTTDSPFAGLLTFDMGPNVLTVGGDFDLTNVDTLNNNSGNLTMNGTGATLTSNGKTLYDFEVSGGSVSASGTTTIAHNLTLSSGSLTGPASGTINLAGNWTNTGGSFVHNSGTVNFNGGGTQTVTTGNTMTNVGCSGTAISQTSNRQFYNFTISGGSVVLASSSDLGVDNDLTISSGSFDIGNATDNFIVIKGNLDLDAVLGSAWNMRETTWTGACGQVVMNGSSATQRIYLQAGQTYTFNSLTFGDIGATERTYYLSSSTASAATLQFRNYFIILSGTVDTKDGSQGDVNVSWDTADVGEMYVGEDFGEHSATTKVFNANASAVTVGGLYVSDGQTSNSKPSTYNAMTSTLTVNAAIKVGNSSQPTRDDNTFDATTASTNAIQAESLLIDVGDVQATSNRPWTLTYQTTAAPAFEMSPSTTFNATGSTSTWSIAGNLTFGTTVSFTAGSTNFLLNGTSTYNDVKSDTDLTFNNLTLDDTANRTVTLYDADTSGRRFDVDGTFNWVGTTPATAVDVQVGSGSFPATLALNNATAANSSIAVPTGRSLTMIGAGTLELAGDYTNSGTFTANSSTVLADGVNQQTFAGTMSGSSQFNNLTITNNSGSDPDSSPSVIFSAGFDTAGTLTAATNNVKLRFASGATYAPTAINFSGTSGNLVTLRSSTPGTAATFSVGAGSRTVTYTSVKDNDACGSSGGEIDASDGTNVDLGNTPCWLINTLTVALSANTLDLGTLSASQVNQNGVTSTVTTNASGGYISLVKYNQTLTAGSSTIADAAGGTIGNGDDEYGASTDSGGTVDLASTSNSCATGTGPMNATGLSTTFQSFAASTTTASAEATKLCLVASAPGSKDAGQYQSTLTVVTTGKF